MTTPDSCSSGSSESSGSSSAIFDPVQLVSSLPPSSHPNPTTIANENSSQSNVPAIDLSGFTSHPSQSTQLTSLASNTQSSEDHSKPTSAAYGMNLSAGPADQNQRSEDHPTHSPTGHEPGLDGAQSPYTTSQSSQRIVELGYVEEQLAQLLNLGSDILGSLTPPLDETEATNGALKSFSSSIHDYYELLNKIQLGLRTSMSQLRAARISTRILFEPAHPTIANCPVGLGHLHLPTTRSSIQAAPEQPMLSVGSLVAERNAWKDFVDSLDALQSKRAL